MKNYIALLLILLFPAITLAQDWPTDATPTVAEVQSLVNGATAGDTITFQGDATWSSSVTVGKNITINGNGHTLTTSGSMGTGFFNVTGFSASSLVRITGFTFQMTNWTPYTAIFVQGMTGGVTVGNIRIDHNVFYFGQSPIYFYHGKGLVDNNFFYNSVIAVQIDAGSRANADESWASMAAGTADAIFIETNHFITNANYTLGYTQEQIGSENGSKMVVRYNTFNATGIPIGDTYYPFMAHGNAAAGDKPGYWERSTGCRRGQSVIEYYNNTITGPRVDFLYQSRGSVNLVHDNAITGTVQFNPRIYLWEEEYDMDDWTADLRTAWPAEDQVHNTFIWNNTYQGHDFNDGVYGYVESSPNASAGLQLNRDFFKHAPCSGSASTDAYGNTCTHGKSTFSNLNGFTDGNGASSSHPGDGSSYTPHGTMSFTASGDNAYLGYVPYTYPHPLASGATTWQVTFDPGAHGTITQGSTPQTVNDGANCSPVGVTASTGYHFTSWSPGGSTNNPITITGVTADATYTAQYAADSTTYNSGRRQGGMASGGMFR